MANKTPLPAPAAPPEESTDFLKIDEHRLDWEWLRHSEIYAQHAIRAAKSQRTRDTAKSDLELTIAEVDDRIRAQPLKYGIEKITEGAVKAAVAKHPRVVQSQSDLNDAQYRFNVRNAMLNALEHKKRALTMLVNLYQSNYFSDPKVVAGRALKEKMEMGQQARVSKLTQLQREDGED